MTLRTAKFGLATALVVLLAAGLVVVLRSSEQSNRTTVTAYFTETNGLFPGDEVRILGVRVGKIDTIEPQPTRAKVTFWFDNKYEVPADATAAIVSPSLVTARAIQLVPAYPGSGPTMRSGAIIGQDRTAVPIEFDEFREQLDRLNHTLQPTEPGGVAPLGSVINTAADNLRGQGPSIRDTVIKVSQALSTLGDHSGDIFTTIKNLSLLVSALQDSADVMRSLNRNLASVTGLLADDPNEVRDAVKDLNGVIGEVQSFVADNRETVGTTSDKLTAVTQALTDSLDDIKQALHLAPTTVSNVNNIYKPAQAASTGALAINNFADPISFLCGAIQAASRLGAEQSAKLCVQYLAPIIKNRQYNFPPIGTTIGLAAPFPVVGAAARPNEITYSEDWMRPDYIPPPAAVSAPAPDIPPVLPAEAVATNPSAGLPGIMVPPGSSGQ